MIASNVSKLFFKERSSTKKAGTLVDLIGKRENGGHWQCSDDSHARNDRLNQECSQDRGMEQTREHIPIRHVVKLAQLAALSNGEVYQF